MPFQFETQYDFRIAPADLFIAIGCVAIALTRNRFNKVSNASALAGLWLAMTISLATTLYRTGGLTRYVLLNKYCGLMGLLALYWFFSNVVNHAEDVRRLMRLFVVVVSLQNCVFLATYIGAHWFGFVIAFLQPSDRLSGLLVDPNAYGGLLACALALQLVTYRSSRPLVGGMLGILVLATLATSLLFTFSRSAWLACAFIVGTSMVLSKRAVLALVLLGFFGATYWLRWASTEDRAFIGALADRQEQVDVRLYLAARVLEDFRQSPILGIGIGAFSQRETNIIHNTSLWFLAEMGLVGLSALYWFLGSVFTSAIGGLRAMVGPPKVLMSALLSAHLGMFGLSMGIEALYQRHWWFVMSMISALVATGVRPHALWRPLALRKPRTNLVYAAASVPAHITRLAATQEPMRVYPLKTQFNQ